MLDDGKESIAIVVADSCMMPRPLLDEAKTLAAQRTKIKPDRILISATHTHTAPASMSCLGTDLDPNYVPVLRQKTGRSHRRGSGESRTGGSRLGRHECRGIHSPAALDHPARPDRTDPFGNPTLRANMHAGANWDNVTGESGPEDPDLSMISFRSRTGRPIALLANFSMHYFGTSPRSAPITSGCSARTSKRKSAVHRIHRRPAIPQLRVRRDHVPRLQRRYLAAGLQGAGRQGPAMDHGTVCRRPVGNRPEGLFDDRIRRQCRPCDGRGENSAEIPRARCPEAGMGTPHRRENGRRLPKTTEEVYAREQILLNERQSTEVVVQALRIGKMAIATTPTETYALTGLKIKLRSPLPQTMVIELANGGDGYIPPPEQHLLGG